MSTQSIPYCNINTINGEFFSNKKEKYQKDVEDNKKQKNIFSLGFGLNIFFFILLIFIGFVLYNSNKKLQNQNQNNEENKDITQFVSLWTPGVVISLIIGILCLISMFFTGYKTIKLNHVNEEIPIPAIDDIYRPCYSRTTKQYIQSNQNSTNSTSPGVDVSLNTIVTTGANLNSLNTRINDQTLNTNTTFTGTGLDQLKGLQINFGSSQNTNTNNSNTNTQNVVSDTTGVGNLSLDTNKTYSNTASGTASSTGNQGPVTVTSNGTPIVTGTSNQGPSSSSSTNTRLNSSSTT